jgi:hypothetical protein
LNINPFSSLMIHNRGVKKTEVLYNLSGGSGENGIYII